MQHVEGNLSAAAGTCTLRPDTRKLLITCNRSSVSFRCKSLLFQVLSAKFCDNVLKIFHSEAFPAYPANAPPTWPWGTQPPKENGQNRCCHHSFRISRWGLTDAYHLLS